MLESFSKEAVVKRELFCRKSVLENFAKFTGKRLRPATLLKKETLAQVFPVNFVKFLRAASPTERLR